MGDNAAARILTSTCRRPTHKWKITTELEARSQMQEEMEKQKESEEENAKWFEWRPRENYSIAIDEEKAEPKRKGKDEPMYVEYQQILDADKDGEVPSRNAETEGEKEIMVEIYMLELSLKTKKMEKSGRESTSKQKS